MMWGWGASSAVWIVELVLVGLAAAGGAAAAVLTVARRAGTWADGARGGRARSILDERLAAGEIETDEYERLRAVMGDATRPDR
ncbi:MAG: SHOCT domain-containing protein [Pseudonocardiaceae bacterium]|nr:MAG: SHOCT domain-containing protein [Pseudonocardiaceae bacterium]